MFSKTDLIIKELIVSPKRLGLFRAIEVKKQGSALLALPKSIRAKILARLKDKEVHEAAQYALRSTLGAQYPIGAWGHNYDRFVFETPSKSHYPVIKASFPDTWTRQSQNDFNGCYMFVFHFYI